MAKREMIPESCAHLDLKDVERALMARTGSVPATARALNVPVRDLRTLLKIHPELMSRALEQLECALDQARAAVFEALENPDLAIRFDAATIVLRLASAAPRRGWVRRPDGRGAG
jgi:hypothetical protein